MSTPFIGQIVQGGWNFAPRGYAFCNGQSLSIQQNTALFSLLGTTFGGNGTTTFNLPNLLGRSMMHWGNGAGLSPRQLGESGGAEQVTLTTPNLPAHNHSFSSTSSLNAATPKATLNVPAAGALLARSVDNTGTVVPYIYAPAGTTPTVALGGLNVAGTVGITGSNVPVGIVSPFQCVSHCIALQGIFPSRN
jgi:microcystin-dependent protein